MSTQSAAAKKPDTVLMTEGSIFRNILFFSAPLILGNLLQQTYNAADSIIVGNFVGSNALAAVGSSTSLIYLLIAFSQGASVGASVIVSQYLGAQEEKRVRLSVHTAFAIAGILGASVKNAVIAVALVSWTKYARLARSLVLKIRNRDFVSAAIVTGSKTPYILRKYMLPNVIPTLVITAATDIGGMMLELAGLSFLGFGAKAPTPEWGLMLNEGRQFISNAPWMMFYPGLAIFVVVVVFNLLGDALRDVLDPRDE